MIGAISHSDWTWVLVRMFVGLTGVSLVIGLVLAWMRRPAAYRLLRVSFLAAGLCVSSALLLGLAVNLAMANAFASLSQNEIRMGWFVGLLFGLPFYIGIVSAVGPHREWVKQTGRCLVYAFAPFGWVMLVAWKVIDHRADAMVGSLVFLAGLVFCWEMHCRAARAKVIHPRVSCDPMGFPPRDAG